MANHAVSNRADLGERTKTMSRHGDRRGQIADFRDSFETINWLYLLFKCGIKTKTQFEWLLWHWSSLGQLNLEPTRPNGLVGCKVPTDLVKISVKEATHMDFRCIACPLLRCQAITWSNANYLPIRFFGSNVSEIQLISLWTKWPPFLGRHFQMHFHEWKVHNNSALVQIMAWRRTGNKPDYLNKC